ncbi:hypothetical protein N7456_000015 [Penicillium angulare]|uniref:Uncharacterized protein n=1 Tax=Penicillium angulare TaxID=116970 RepID=A0A9W9KQJ3_9EURO|nr:hypothetical protein N7456_000015 [Penicillium angulare]
MKFQVALATILLPLAAMAAPTAENDIRLVQAIPVVKAESETQSAPHSTGLEELSKRSNISCKIVNTSSAYVNCRSGPGFQYSILAYVLPGGTYTFHCYKSGSCYQNNWYVIYTFQSGFKLCSL